NSTSDAISIKNTRLKVLIRGCKLYGEGTDRNAGIALRNCTDVRVESCDAITNFKRGISIESCSRVDITGGHIYSCYVGVSIEKSENVSITAAAIDSTTFAGISIQSSSASCKIMDNNITRNGNDGIICLVSDKNTFCHNLLSDNYRGFSAIASEGNIIRNNEIVRNKDCGMALISCRYNVIEFNNISSNGVLGISFDKCASNRVADNMVCDNSAGAFSPDAEDLNDFGYNSLVRAEAYMYCFAIFGQVTVLTITLAMPMGLGKKFHRTRVAKRVRLSVFKRVQYTLSTMRGPNKDRKVIQEFEKSERRHFIRRHPGVLAFCILALAIFIGQEYIQAASQIPAGNQLSGFKILGASSGS
nr:right-handed parallel beta-helix repeat-containing protein [Candidatus Sigynarchaeota archaeon]